MRIFIIKVKKIMCTFINDCLIKGVHFLNNGIKVQLRVAIQGKSYTVTVFSIIIVVYDCMLLVINIQLTTVWKSY